MKPVKTAPPTNVGEIGKKGGVPAAGGPGKSANTNVGRVTTKGGGTVEKSANGNATYRGPNNTTAHFTGNKVTEAKRGPTEIRRPGGGPRTVTEVRGSRTVVAHSAGRGYVQRAVVAGGHRLVQRTFYAGGRVYVQAYRPYNFNGSSLFVFAPGGFYPAGYYGVMMDPWADPVDYPWGWMGSPWFGVYGRYFSPWGGYMRPSMWLTDFVVANTLRAAFEARAEQNLAAGEEPIAEGTPLSDEVKGMIEQEVREEIAEEQVQAQQPDQSDPGLPPSLTDGSSHTFLADDNLEVQDSNGGTCVIGEGDAVQFGGLPDRGTTANVVVLASKGTNCPAGTTVAVQVPDLVEMQNGMRERVEEGMETLRTEQGTNGLPSVPEDFAAAPAPTLFSASIRPDADAITLIADELQRADKIEGDIMADARASGILAPAAPYTTVELSQRAPVYTPAGAPPPADDRESKLLAGIQVGQSESEVTAIMGVPLSTSFLGGVKKQYEYNSGKIIFTDGDVSDVQILAGARPAELAAQEPEMGAVPTMSAMPVRSGGRVAIGQSESEVVALLGQPARVSFLGGLKKQYEYGDRKIVFTDGQVSDVQQ